MKKVLVLLAGYPATGKSTFSAKLLGRYPDFSYLVPDEQKERLWDEIGFDDDGQKAALERTVWVDYYAEMERAMRFGRPVLTDYPFSDKQKPYLAMLAERFGYACVTIRFVGDLREVFKRSHARDVSQGRHLGHLVSHYRRGDVLEDRTTADRLVDFATLEGRCVSKGYGTFCLGSLIEIDATDIAHVDFDAPLDRLGELIEDAPVASLPTPTEEDLAYWDDTPTLTDDQREVLAACDHTLLAQRATWAEVKQILDDAIRYGCASACIPPCQVANARAYVGSRLRITTVIGFPNGYATTQTKEFEARQAVDDGADELDMVINLGMVAEGDYAAVEREIGTLRAVAGTDHTLKVIVETCLLSEEEKVRVCEAVTAAGADFIKTSTGFSTGGATVEDVRLMREHVGSAVGVKASGGIHSLQQARALMDAGASRLGASGIVKAVKAGC